MGVYYWWMNLIDFVVLGGVFIVGGGLVGVSLVIVFDVVGVLVILLDVVLLCCVVVVSYDECNLVLVCVIVNGLCVLGVWLYVVVCVILIICIYVSCIGEFGSVWLDVVCYYVDVLGWMLLVCELGEVLEWWLEVCIGLI